MVIVSMRMNELEIIQKKTSEKMRRFESNLKKTLTCKGQALETPVWELPVSI